MIRVSLMLTVSGDDRQPQTVSTSVATPEGDPREATLDALAELMDRVGL